MRSVCLVPYCPWPANTGTKVEMMKHLEVLKKLGPCMIASARGKPVGFGWTDEAIHDLRAQGYQMIFREDFETFRPVWLAGFVYAWACTKLKFERAFGHSNPYHRYAFSSRWWRTVTRDADLAAMHYGFWGRFSSSAPQALVLHEVLSRFHWEGSRRENREWKKSALICVVGHDEAEDLYLQGFKNVLWSPPAIDSVELPLTGDIGIVGTKAPQNLEGLRWLESAANGADVKVQVFGNLAEEVRAPFLTPVGRYGCGTEPYARCGIHLMTRPDRPGLQIKVVEALAYGRAIIARKGSMRGLPPGERAWIEVDDPGRMLTEAQRLSYDRAKRESLAAQACAYYKKYLDSRAIKETLRAAYERAAKGKS